MTKQKHALIIIDHMTIQHLFITAMVDNQAVCAVALD